MEQKGIVIRILVLLGLVCCQAKTMTYRYQVCTNQRKPGYVLLSM